MTQHQTIAAPITPVRDHRLLLARLEQAGFDGSGQEFVARTFAGQPFWQQFPAEAVLRLSAVARQHGLFDQALDLLCWLNAEHPALAAAWTAHLELLYLLARTDDLAMVSSRAADHLDRETMQQWQQRLAALQPSQETPASQDLLDPFVQLRREEEDLDLFSRLFRGRDEAFARQWADRDQEKQGYVPIRRPLQPDDLRDHLAGRKTYGIYLLTTDNQVHTGVIDVDLVSRLRPPRAAKAERSLIKREARYLFTRLHELAAAAGLVSLCEVSGGKGYHYWFPVAEPIAAKTMRSALQSLVARVKDDVQCFALEVFPKQERLSGKGFGNLVKLPLGIHRGTGRRSRFVPTASHDLADQFALLRTIQVTAAQPFLDLDQTHRQAPVLPHPRLAAWADKYPELARLQTCCPPLAHLFAMARAGEPFALREEKVLLGTLAHLPRGRLLLHHLMAGQPEYNRPLLDYKINRVRGTVLGCKRIHSLLEQGPDLPCQFPPDGYPHPLRHLGEDLKEPQPVAERITNLQDALTCLKTALCQVERFL